MCTRAQQAGAATAPGRRRLMTIIMSFALAVLAVAFASGCSSAGKKGPAQPAAAQPATASKAAPGGTGGGGGSIDEPAVELLPPPGGDLKNVDPKRHRSCLLLKDEQKVALLGGGIHDYVTTDISDLRVGLLYTCTIQGPNGKLANLALGCGQEFLPLYSQQLGANGWADLQGSAENAKVAVSGTLHAFVQSSDRQCIIDLSLNELTQDALARLGTALKQAYASAAASRSVG